METSEFTLTFLCNPGYMNTCPGTSFHLINNFLFDVFNIMYGGTKVTCISWPRVTKSLLNQGHSDAKCKIIDQSISYINGTFTGW
jgi:hypothetical protein